MLYKLYLKNKINVLFLLIFGLANAINDYLRLKVCAGNFKP